MSKSILFHTPKPIEGDSAFGSKVRPFKLIQAFESLGCDLEVVAGTSDIRKKKIKRVIKELENGRHFDLLYSESSNAPIPVSDEHHLPVRPFIDYIFFSEVKKRNIPVGLYYRDIFWKFPVFRNKLSLFKRILSLPLYKIDWKIYEKYVDHLFLPSVLMSKYLHTSWARNRISALPPGCSIINCEHDYKKNSELICFYVGAIEPPIYDIKNMLDLIAKLEHVRLILCCREDEWLRYKSYYGGDYKNIEVIHESGDDLRKYYCRADLFITAWKGDPYLEFAMPIKLFESLGYGVPIVITEGSEAARFVKENEIGWNIREIDELSGLLTQLVSNRHELDLKREIVKRVRSNHTWEERAKQIIAVLTS